MPLAIPVLGIAIFSLNTTEIMVAGLLPSLSSEFGVSVGTVGLLISVYALGMVVGGPVLTVALLRLPRKMSLLGLLAVFVAGQVLGATAQEFWVLVVARVITALAASAFFGIAMAVSAQLVEPERRGRALSTLFAGLMTAHVVGLPAATLIDQHFGWRASFWAVAALAASSALAVARLVPRTPAEEGIDVRTEIGAFRNRRLWVAYGTNALIIGAIMAANSYFSPIFVDVTGFSPGTVPWLFGLFGVGTIIGNLVMGRFSDRYMMPMLGWGFAATAAVLAAFALVAEHQGPTLVAVALLGLIGLPLSPVLSTRVIKIANPGPLVNTVNASAINVGVVLGPWAGGQAIDAGLGTVSPLWIGCGMALAALAAVLLGRARLPAGAPDEPREGDGGEGRLTPRRRRPAPVTSVTEPASRPAGAGVGDPGQLSQGVRNRGRHRITEFGPGRRALDLDTVRDAGAAAVGRSQQINETDESAVRHACFRTEFRVREHHGHREGHRRQVVQRHGAG